MAVCSRCQHKNTDGARFCVHCGALMDTSGHGQAQADPMIGRVLADRFRIVDELGEGGMGKVYRAEQKMGTSVRNVAIKVLHKDLSSNPDIVARFNRECATVIELHHPNTVRFYDFGEFDDGMLFIAMELIEGQSLAELLEHGSIDEARTEHLFEQVCGSLHEAHELGIVHRDLKPENVLLTDRAGDKSFVKVLDFGIAKQGGAEGETSSLTKAGTILGTPPYMSPEQFRGTELDRRSDIYSLGVMAYEMLTGRLPFEAKTPWEWATKHLTEEPLSIESHVQTSQISQAKKSAIMTALSKEPDDRQATAMQFLEEFRSGHVSAVATDKLPALQLRPRHGLLVAAALTLFGLAFFFLGNDQSEESSNQEEFGQVDISVGGSGTNVEEKVPKLPLADAGRSNVSLTVPTPVPILAVKAKKPPPVRKTKKSKAISARTRGKDALSSAWKALRDDKFNEAVLNFQIAKRDLGSTIGTRMFSNKLSTRGSKRISSLIKSKRCTTAKSIYRSLVTVGAAGSSKSHFSKKRCPLR